MSAKRATGVANKSDAVREYLSANPEAKLKDVSAALEANGIQVSTALINKIKYGDKKGKRGRKRKNGSQETANHTSNGSGGAERANGDEGKSKAQAIRDAFATLGRGARPRDIIAHLSEQGVTVSAAQVSALRKKVGRRGRPPRAVGTSAAAASSSTASGPGISEQHLLAAKRLADQVGIDAARKALDLLARLSS